MKSSILALIPARGGSKRLHSKNLRGLGGVPLVSWSIRAARASAVVETTCVSTDDPEIARVAADDGAEVPFLRPAELATDTASSFEVAVHAIEHYRIVAGKEYDYLMLLQPTSPFRTSADIDAAFGLLESRGAENVVSVCMAEHHPLWCNTLPKDLSLANFLSDDLKNRRSQDLPTYYRLNGAIYLCLVERLLLEKTFIFSRASYAYVMPRERSVDIDTEMDLAFAEFLLGHTTAAGAGPAGGPTER